jgi:hypothetical protein
MKHTINETYPDETLYTIAVLNQEEEDKIREFLKKNKSELVEFGK